MPRKEQRRAKKEQQRRWREKSREPLDEGARAYQKKRKRGTDSIWQEEETFLVRKAPQKGRGAKRDATSWRDE